MIDQLQPNLNAVTLRDHLRLLFRQKSIVILSFLTVVLTVYVSLQLSTPLYTAQVKMLITAEKQVESQYYRELEASRNTQVTLTQSEIVKSMPVLERTVESLGLQNRTPENEKKFARSLKWAMIEQQERAFRKHLAQVPMEQVAGFLVRRAVDELRGKVEVAPIRDTFLFTIKVSDYDPQMAAMTANTISRSYIIYDLEQQLAELKIKYGARHPTVIQLKDQIDDRIENLTGNILPTEDAIGPASVKIIEQANVPFQPEGKSKKSLMLLAALVGLMMGVVLAYLFDYLDHTIKTPWDLQEKTRLPLLGAIPIQRWWGPKIIRNSSWLMRHSLYWHSYHNLAGEIMLLVGRKQVRSILFTGPDANQGVSTALVNVAYFMSQKMEQKVLVIDANFRNSDLHRIFKIPAGPGLYELLSGQQDFESSVKKLSPYLSVIPLGLKNPANINLNRMQEIIDFAKTQYDLVLIDCSDLKNYKDTLALAGYADGVVFLVSEGATRISVIHHTLNPLKDGPYNILGTVLNNRTFPIPAMIYDRI